MKLPLQLSSEIDYLIPEDVIDACELDKFDVEILLNGVASCNQYPQIKIWIDDIKIWDGTIINEQRIIFFHKINLQKTNICLRIEMHSKDEQTGTTVDATGKIIENQSASIKKIIINDVDIVKNNSIYEFGYFYPHLSESKAQYFISHGHSISPTHTLNMSENGEWRLNFGIPVLQSIAKKVSPQRSVMPWPDNDFLIRIIERCDRINRLQKIKESRKQL